MALEAFITKELLTWARKRSIGGLDDAAKKLRINKAKLIEWENGDSRPTFHQAQELAKKLKIPFGYLYLSKPPVEDLPLPDLRVKPGVSYGKPSPDFLAVLYDAMRKQEWYHEYLLNQDADPVPFYGKYSHSSPINKIAEEIRRALRLDEQFRLQAHDRERFFSGLVERAEKIGVLVIRNSVVGNNTHRPLDSDEFQGFAISDDLAPMVFINTNDYLSAQIFTLVHELAHIWMGVTGVSIQDYLYKPTDQDNFSQQKSDEIAAEVLVPATEFTQLWKGYDNVDQGIKELQKFYRVSGFVILRRTFELGMINFDIYRSMYDELRSGITPKKAGGGGGYGIYFSRNSSTITTTLLHSVHEGKVLPTEASKLLNVSPVTLFNMQNYLASKER